MSTSSSRIEIFLYFGGELSSDGWSVTYDQTPIAAMRIPRSSSYAKFYDKNEGRLDVGMLFKNKEALIEAVKDHSIRYARREYWVPESSKTKWKMGAARHLQTKNGKVDNNKIRRGPYMYIDSNVPRTRTCKMQPVVRNQACHPDCERPYRIRYSISKGMVHLKMAREMVYGTWESSVQKLPKYLRALQKYNPGTIVEWQHKARDTSTGAYVIGYVFWAFKSCIEGFQHCRNLISVDGTHLYTKYKHKMLIAAAMDGNQQVLPLAFAVVDEESLLSWKWFLRQLSRHIIRGRRGICLISDRHAGITRAVRECPDFVPPNGVHRYCLRHVCSNFNSKYKNVVLKDLCWRAGSEYQIRKFNRTMEEIKKQSLEAFQWLDRIDKEKWTGQHHMTVDGNAEF
ncbi:UNVERIFIED_CONTAM: hypothetical protein Sindi_0013600 [Sesamum indicum]